MTTPSHQAVPAVQQRYKIVVAITPILAEPSQQAICTSEALYGETVTLLSEHRAWMKVRQSHDGYEGYVQSHHLRPIDPHRDIASSHWVAQRSTLLFQQPDFKSPAIYQLPFAAEVSLVSQVNSSFSRTGCGYYIWSAHCLPLGKQAPVDALTLAKSVFLGTVYRWGGRTPQGIDCSGLIQMLARSQGCAIPRDSGDQEAFLTSSTEQEDYQAFDLVYWPGHTGILLSPTEILHATAHSLNCVIEPIAAVIERAGPIRSTKRLFGSEGPY